MSFQENNNENNQNNEKNDVPKAPNSGLREDISEFNDAESNVSGKPEEPPSSSENDRIVSLEKELASVNEKLSETHNKMLRIAADADNTRKRLEKEKMETRIYAIQEFARDLLPVIDSFEKALQSIEAENGNSENNSQSAMVEGVKLVSKIFQDVTKKHGIERVPGKGSPFNPTYHNAIAKEVDNNYKSETVIEEFMPGYKIGDRILRTALVKVGAPD